MDDESPDSSQERTADVGRFRDACRRAMTRLANIDIAWRRLDAARRTVSAKWADRPVRSLPAFQLDSIVGSVRDEWTRQGHLNDLPRKDVTWLPYAVFHPESNKDAWLARDANFMEAALSRMRLRTRTVRSLLRNVLRLWPKDLSTSGQIQQMLLEELGSATVASMVEWRQRVEEFDLLSLHGPRKLAARLTTSSNDRSEMLTKAGLTGELAKCQFLAETDRHIATALSEHLKAGRTSELEPLLFLLAPDGELTFPGQAPDVANALLLPFASTAPLADTKRRIRAFLLTHMKDPRLTQKGWTRVDPAAKQVMLRWLVETSLEDFFNLIEHSADNDHWHYRKAFWEAYRRRDHIADAWVILGENAAADAQRHWRKDVPASGRLQRANVGQSVLLMQIGNLVVSEWSHNGTCRVWRRNDPRCPPFYRSEYSAEELRHPGAHQQKHHGNLYYTWQQKLSAFIREETAIAVPQTEYRVR